MTGKKAMKNEINKLMLRKHLTELLHPSVDGQMAEKTTTDPKVLYGSSKIGENRKTQERV